MKSIKLTISMLALVLAAPSHAARPPQTPTVAARYVVTISDLNARFVQIEATFEHAPATLSMDDVQADHLDDGWATFIEDLQATDAGGSPVQVRPAGRARWAVTIAGPLRVTYRVNLRFADERWPSGNEQAGIRTENAIYLVTRSLFLAPDVTTATEVRFEIPSGWRVSSPWQPIGASDRVFQATARDDLQRNIVVVGRHAELTSTAGPLTLLLALPGRAAAAASLVDPAFRAIAARYTALFSSTPPGRFMLAIAYADRDDGEGFTRAGGFTVSDEITPQSTLVWGNFLAHEMLHFWNGRQIRGSEPRASWAWFREGATEYLANLMLYRADIIDEDALIKKIERHAGNYAYFASAPVFERMSLTAAGRDSGRFRFGVYDGGWTAALCLDGLIRDGSGGRASFDVLMRRLYDEFGLRGRGYTHEDLIDISSELARTSTRSFFERHVTGTEPLPVRQCLARVGLKAAVKDYAAEVFVTRDVWRHNWPGKD